jgi:hypothetical protein
MRLAIARAQTRRAFRSVGILGGCLVALLVVTNRDARGSALAVSLGSTIVTSLVWPLFLQSRARPLSEQDAAELRELTARGRRRPGRSQAIALGPILVVGLWWVSPPLGALVLGMAMGTQLALLYWCRTAKHRIGDSGLDTQIRNFAITNPSDPMFGPADPG